MPQFVLEVTSKKTRVEDEGNKKGLYQRLGVEEYFLFDPEGDYLAPRLQGFRRQGSELRPVRLGPGGALESRVLGLNLVAEGERLRFIEAGTGVKLRFYDELGDDAARLAEKLRELGVEPDEIT